MRKILGFATVLMMSAAFSLAAEKSWSGKISDSNCGRSHKSTIEHSGKKMTDHDCALVCVKSGAKYVFVSGSKIYNVANQDYAGLEEHAGHDVKLTGEMTGDTIKVSKIEMAGKASSKETSEKKPSY
jgi:hypothetical protein